MKGEQFTMWKKFIKVVEITYLVVKAIKSAIEVLKPIFEGKHKFA